MIKESDVAEGVGELINTEFHLWDQLHIIFGWEDGSLYDPNINEIHVPYSFIEKVKARFVVVDYDNTGVGREDAIMNAFMYALFHEVAYSYVHV
ncbi:DUF4344 domain-containing metallopeptidase [Marinomonas sp. 2405UD68-3]|uniref:DUF4344 domain-containing metallopeptidase n=1 Tax=Marinomonas sp. 2405UD68-3 TaxID=3391835 RepID=UPI0039C995B6